MTECLSVDLNVFAKKIRMQIAQWEVNTVRRRWSKKIRTFRMYESHTYIQPTNTVFSNANAIYGRIFYREVTFLAILDTYVSIALRWD